jgi:hypothetical protein
MIVILVITMAWTLVPPFPSPSPLTALALPALTARFGRPSIEDSDAVRPGVAAVWDKSRGLAIWSLRAEWRRGTAESTHPAFMSLCFRIKLAPRQSSFCYASIVVGARVLASNLRWSGHAV